MDENRFNRTILSSELIEMISMNLSILDVRIQKKIVTIVIPQCQVYNQLVYGKSLRSIETAIYTCENTYTHMMQLRKYSGKNFMFV